MAGVLFYLPTARQLSIAGRILPGWKLQFFLSETDTPTPVYSDGDLSSSLGVEVTADGAGEMVPIYVDPTIVYRVKLLTADDVLIDDVDPYDVSRGSGGGIESIVAGTNITVDATDPANPIVSASGGGGSVKMAFGCIDSDANLLAGSQNIDSFTRLSTGVYVIDYTSANFAFLPSVVLTHSENNSSFGSGCIFEITGAGITVCQIQSVSSNNPGTPRDEGFNIIAVGL